MLCEALARQYYGSFYRCCRERRRVYARRVIARRGAERLYERRQTIYVKRESVGRIRRVSVMRVAFQSTIYGEMPEER